MLGDSCVDLGQGFPNYDPPDFVVQVPGRGWRLGACSGVASLGLQGLWAWCFGLVVLPKPVKMQVGPGR